MQNLLDNLSIRHIYPCMAGRQRHDPSQGTYPSSTAVVAAPFRIQTASAATTVAAIVTSSPRPVITAHTTLGHGPLDLAATATAA